MIAQQSQENIPGGSLTVKRGVENHRKTQTSKVFLKSCSVNFIFLEMNNRRVRASK